MYSVCYQRKNDLWRTSYVGRAPYGPVKSALFSCPRSNKQKLYFPLNAAYSFSYAQGDQDTAAHFRLCFVSNFLFLFLSLFISCFFYFSHCKYIFNCFLKFHNFQKMFAVSIFIHNFVKSYELQKCVPILKNVSIFLSCQNMFKF